ncbi:MAG: UDP-N-acetylmuramate--L-alanine ligase [Patescibacteria group bacterium]|nr:UDP-N-acetylmuramate--L-alanine ligase [Patescibacteria group bacterium]
MSIHFIGIGGIGVSSLAKYYFEKGYKVSGSDLNSSEITDFFKTLKIKIFIGKHKKENLLKGIDLVIYSPAIKENNPELKKARKIGIKIQSYPQAIGELTKRYYTIAVSGTHGKSTTTAMLSLILVKAGLDPTVIIGTKIREFNNSNCRVGKSKYLVVEADEWNASFLNYWPKIIILTNIEKDHLDYYKNLSNLLNGFQKLIKHLPQDGKLIINKDDENIQKILSNKQSSINNKFLIISYQLSKFGDSKKIKKILKVPGEHNIYNALAALSGARALKIPDKISFKSLSEYKGCWRRFEEKNLKIGNKKIKIISDYAHHPTEVRATIMAAKEKFGQSNKKIWLIFQPHQYQRTFYLFNDFVEVIRENPIDKLIITDIYDVAGREKKEIKKIISSEMIIKKIHKDWALYLPKRKIISYLKNCLKGEEIVIIMGAGDIYKIINNL